MKVIKSPNVYSSLPIHDKKIIFLAGSIEMGKAENWQEEIIEVLKESQLNIESTIVLNPRREDWDFSWNQSIKNSNFREQVEWELTGIITETEEYLYPEDNEGCSTMELIDGNGNTIWDNSNLELVKNKKLSTEQIENIWKECYGEDLKEQYEGFYNKLKDL